MLAGFIAYLEKNHLVEFDILREDDAGFRNRFRLQTYVFLARRFGLELDYPHDMYLYGPRSRKLAEDYYDIAENRDTLYNEEAKEESGRLLESSPSFRSSDFLSFVKDRDDDWLEIAATLMSRNEAGFTEKHDLVENVEWTKDGFSIDYIEKVLVDLQEDNLVALTH